MKQYQQVCTSGFLLNDKNEVLLVKRSMSDDFLPGLWELPGGGTDFEEITQDGLLREMKEEVGIGVVVGRPVSVTNYFIESENEKIQRIEIVFKCTSKKTNVVLSHEHSKYKWISQKDLKNLEMTKYMQKILKECFV